MNGVLRAPIEHKLQLFEILINCLMMGYAMSFVIQQSEDKFNQRPYSMIWMVIDCLTSLLSFAYVSFSQKIMIDGEITRNIATLHTVQDLQMQKSNPN